MGQVLQPIQINASGVTLLMALNMASELVLIMVQLTLAQQKYAIGRGVTTSDSATECSEGCVLSQIDPELFEFIKVSHFGIFPNQTPGQ